MPKNNGKARREWRKRGAEWRKRVWQDFDHTYTGKVLGGVLPSDIMRHEITPKMHKIRRQQEATRP